MKFYEVQKALEDGKKIRRNGMSPNEYFELDTKIYTTLTIGSLVRVECVPTKCINRYKLTDDDLFADDWEIIEEIPEVQLFRSKELRYTCPKCNRESEQLVYAEDKSDAVHECRFCGQKFRFTNLAEIKDMLNDTHKTFEDILKDHGILDLWNLKPPSAFEYGLLCFPWDNPHYTRDDAKKIVNQTIQDYEKIKEKNFEAVLKACGLVPHT